MQNLPEKPSRITRASLFSLMQPGPPEKSSAAAGPTWSESNGLTRLTSEGSRNGDVFVEVLSGLKSAPRRS